MRLVRPTQTEAAEVPDVFDERNQFLVCSTLVELVPNTELAEQDLASKAQILYKVGLL